MPVSRFRPLPGTYISQSEGQSDTQNRDCFRPLPGTYISQSYLLSEHIIPFRFPSPTGDLYFSILESITTAHPEYSFPSPTGDLYFSIPSPQFLVNTDCITQFAWEMIFQKYKFIFHYKKLSKCLFYAVRGKTNIF